jgi:hypothetical protein
LAGCTIGLNEFSPTGNEIAEAMSIRFGKGPRVKQVPDAMSYHLIEIGHPVALAESVKLEWSEGEHSVGDDIYTLEVYEKSWVGGVDRTREAGTV